MNLAKRFEQTGRFDDVNEAIGTIERGNKHGRQFHHANYIK